VALLDTGVGRHPWFAHEDGTLKDGIEEAVHCDGQLIGVLPGPATDPEYRGVVTDPLNGQIDRESGHGTFIAGIVRQRCPQAHILAIPVMAADGSVAEHELLTALGLLLKRHLEATPDRPAEMVDVLSLSLGYYHESPDDTALDAPLRRMLEQYAAAGVAVVAAAGNDATLAPFFPARLADVVSTGVPMTAVGALNPDGATVALFSNAGSWVTAHAVGAAVVSTVPTTLSGSSGRIIEARHAGRLPRTTVDPDDYRSGFAVWSGTSFAAPLIAGDIAAAIAVARGSGDGTDADRDSQVKAVGDAVHTALEESRRRIEHAQTRAR
jgi:subtilisin family serine protease